MANKPNLWLWYARRPAFVPGAIVAVIGVVTWLSGWRYGHGLTTLALFVTLVASVDWKYSLPVGMGGANYIYSLKYLEQNDQKQALRHAAKAVRAFRRLADYRPSETSWYASMLDHQWILLHQAERHREAFDVAEVAVATWRTLAADNATHVDCLCRALNRLIISTDRLILSAEHVAASDESIGCIEESIGIRRRLIAEEEARLAVDLANLSLFHRRLGQWEQAYPPAEERVVVRRRLAVTDPSERGSLADGLGILARMLTTLDRAAEAVRPAAEAVECQRELVTDDPTRRIELISSLNVLGQTLIEAGRPDDAAVPLSEAIELCDETAGGEAADVYSEVGRSLTRIDRLEEALAAHQIAVKEWRTTGERGDLADELALTCAALRRLGRSDDARPAAVEAVAIQRELAKHNPAGRAGLAGALHHLGAVHEDLGEFEAAVELSEQALHLIEQLAEHDHHQLHHLIMSLDDHAVLLQRLSRHTEARQIEGRAAALREQHDRGQPAATDQP